MYGSPPTKSVGGSAYRPAMVPLGPRQEPRLFIGDTGGLMNDVVQTTRRGHLTSLPTALQHRAVRIYIPRHVMTEIERDLPAYSLKLKTPVDPDKALRVWQSCTRPGFGLLTCLLPGALATRRSTLSTSVTLRTR